LILLIDSIVAASPNDDSNSKDVEGGRGGGGRNDVEGGRGGGGSSRFGDSSANYDRQHGK